MNLRKPNIYWIDLFCGAGGTTTGIHLAGSKVIACVNHDPIAIQSHLENHPECVHFTEDIRDLNVIVKLKEMVDALRSKEPDCIINIWASLECTNFSKAKGGLPRDPDSRTLAEHLEDYVIMLSPDNVFIENVEEFMSWGPLYKRGPRKNKPINRLKGIDFRRWIRKMKSHGYQYSYRLLNSANYGAYTSRKRFFCQFAKNGLPIEWPEPTHAKNPDKEDLFGHKKEKWKPVKEVLDLADEGESIFSRKIPLVENSLLRIYAGLVKFVANGETEFLKHIHGGNPSSKVWSIEGAHRTILGSGHHYKVKSIFLTAHYSGGGQLADIDKPCPTVSTKDRFSTVQAQFFTNYYSGGGQHTSLDRPSPSVLQKPKQHLTSLAFIDQQYGNSKPASIERPAATLTSNPKLNLVRINKHYLVNPQYSSKGGSVEDPCFTLIARMDKMPPYLATAKSGEAAIIVYEDDSPAMVKIKEFMAAYGIVDIKMRMLKDN